MTEREVKYEYEPKDGIIEWELHEKHKYLPDFRIGKMLIECKGRLTAADRKKLKAVKAQHPKADLRLVFQFDNKLNPSSPTRYSDWATKNGFKWAVGQVPREWIR